MTRLFLIIYTLAASVLAGSAVVAALTMGLVAAKPIVLAAVAGALVALPVAWVVARQMES
ncbi:CTP synthetase [Neotabrizicola sp. VNH66]|uniref:CTP synthetase n=1 Tax=Neotabrizicola sp. VNH66 TaxID=3400918 RepID=UPI003C035B95